MVEPAMEGSVRIMMLVFAVQLSIGGAAPDEKTDHDCNYPFFHCAPLARN